jgi:hypothetical protein
MSPEEIAAYVRTKVEQSPPLSDRQLTRLRVLLIPRHDEGAARQPRHRHRTVPASAAELAGGRHARR